MNAHCCGEPTVVGCAVWLHGRDRLFVVSESGSPFCWKVERDGNAATGTSSSRHNIVIITTHSARLIILSQLNARSPAIRQSSSQSRGGVHFARFGMESYSSACHTETRLRQCPRREMQPKEASFSE